ncbi:MAG: type II toxin-antitoxin system HicA family toxin [Nitrososphaerota archaeon]|nr:type II toxin-antitoxin system HicA family toxin [Nitrososphaerota archaeon]MDG6939459.1 type II toxin-antitoxin system HicA family toxin [Nitrososphaerota archaeon]
MSKLPVLSWRDVLKALRKTGFVPVRQRGSHIYLVKDDLVVTVPRDKEIKRGTLMAIIAEAGLTKESFLRLL